MPQEARRPVLMLALALLLSGVAAWLILTETAPETEERITAPSSKEPASRDTSTLASGGPAAPAAPSPIETSSFDHGRAAAESVGALHVPDLGDLLERSRSGITLAVVDARGRPVESLGWSGRAKSRMWRRHGGYWQQVAASFDTRQALLRAGRRLDPCLEPGEWTASVALGSYGSAEMSFTLARHDQKEMRLTVPGWRRVVTLRFVDSEGRPIAWLSRPPEFRPRRPGPIPYRRQAPGVLREPPRLWNDTIAIGGGAGSSSYRSRSAFARRRYPTDEGRYAVAVVAGVGGKLRINLSKKLFQRSHLDIESDFTGPEWDDYTVTLQPLPDYATRIANLPVARASDPGGYVRARSPRPRPRTRSSSRDPRDLTRLRSRWARSLVTLAAPDSIFPVVGAGRSVGQFRRHENGLWSVEGSRRHPLALATSDGRLHRRLHEPLDVTAQRLVERSLQDSLAPCRLEVRASPTLAAWARAVSFGLTSAHPGLREACAVATTTRRAEREGRWHVYDSGLIEEARRAVARDATLWAQYGAKLEDTFRYDRQGRAGAITGGTLRFALPLAPEERARLARGSLKLDLTRVLSRTRRHPVLALRVVGDAEEGLPWVEGSVLTADEDAVAQAVRRVSRARGSEGRRPTTMALHSALRALEDEVDASEEILESVEEEVEIDTERFDPSEHHVELIPLPEERDLLAAARQGKLGDYDLESLRHLWRQGAWYATHRRVRSDAAGYVIPTGLRLQPGEVYVLYLWSKSRDDLWPDARLVFQATPGITDLGVVRLPGHDR